MNRRLIGIDIGASGGKMAFGEYDGERLAIREYRDFVNRPVDIGSALYWDVFSLYHAIIDGMAYFKGKYGEADSVAIDTWGASYGLLDKAGRLLEPVYHYRDTRTAHTIADMKQVMDTYELFRLTGCQCNRTYTLPQLYSYKTSNSCILELAESMLLLPDLLGYFLSGEKMTEMTIAGTSCLMENQQVGWSRAVAQRFSIPERIYTEIVDPGTYKGLLSERVQAETGMKKTRLIATVGHDSAAAVAAIPDFGENQLYVSIGTNVNMGVEKQECLLTREAYEKGFKNTSGIDRRKIIYRDFSACWHINEFLRTRREQGITYTYLQMMELAESTKEQVSWFDVEAAELNDAGGDFCRKMNAYFSRSGQRILTEDGEFIRGIYESIAWKIRHYAEALRDLGIEYENIHLINGAVRNHILVQYICNALGRPLRAGMEYATLDGNLLTQLYADSGIGTVEDMRRVSGNSFESKEYLPQEQTYWQEAGERYESILIEARK